MATYRRDSPKLNIAASMTIIDIRSTPMQLRLKLLDRIEPATFSREYEPRSNLDVCRAVFWPHKSSCHSGIKFRSVWAENFPMPFFDQPQVRHSLSLSDTAGQTVGIVPPSMTNSVPVIEEALAEATKATSSATSSGRLGRPNGIPPSISISPWRAVP